MVKESALPVVLKMTYIATLTAAPRGFLIVQLITMFRSLLVSATAYCTVLSLSSLYKIAMRCVTTPEDILKSLLPISNRILILTSLLGCPRSYTENTCIQVHVPSSSQRKLPSLTSLTRSLKIAKEKMLAAKRDFGGYRQFIRRRAFRTCLLEMAHDIKNIIASFLTASFLTSPYVASN